MAFVISIDPGREKCGLLLADIENQTVLDGRIVRNFAVINLIVDWQQKYSVELLLLGNGTNSNYWHSELSSSQPLPVTYVEESGTTLRARKRYFEIIDIGFPFSLLPRSMLLPPKNLDSFAALVILEDYLNKEIKWIGEICLRIWPE